MTRTRFMVTTISFGIFVVGMLILRFRDMHLTEPEFVVAHWRLYAVFAGLIVFHGDVAVLLRRKAKR